MAYEKHVRECCQLAILRQRWRSEECQYRLTVDVYRKANRGDIDNLCKAAGDAINGVAYPDDRLVVELNARMFVDKSNPRMEITVEKLNAE